MIKSRVARAADIGCWQARFPVDIRACLFCGGVARCGDASPADADTPVIATVNARRAILQERQRSVAVCESRDPVTAAAVVRAQGARNVTAVVLNVAHAIKPVGINPLLRNKRRATAYGYDAGPSRTEPTPPVRCCAAFFVIGKGAIRVAAFGGPAIECVWRALFPGADLAVAAVRTVGRFTDALAFFADAVVNHAVPACSRGRQADEGVDGAVEAALGPVVGGVLARRSIRNPSERLAIKRVVASQAHLGLVLVQGCAVRLTRVPLVQAAVPASHPVLGPVRVVGVAPGPDAVAFGAVADVAGVGAAIERVGVALHPKGFVKPIGGAAHRIERIRRAVFAGVKLTVGAVLARRAAIFAFAFFATLEFHQAIAAGDRVRHNQAAAPVLQRVVEPAADLLFAVLRVKLFHIIVEAVAVIHDTTGCPLPLFETVVGPDVVANFVRKRLPGGI